MAQQKINSALNLNNPDFVSIGGTTSRTGFSTIRYGEIQRPGGLYNGYVGLSTGFSFITGSAVGSFEGPAKLIDINISSPFSHRTPHSKTSERTNRYSTVIFLRDGRLLSPGAGIVSNSGILTATDSYGTDNAITTWTSPGVMTYLSNGSAPATGYYS